MREYAAFVPQLVALLPGESAQLSTAAAGALFYLAADQAARIVELGAVPHLVELMCSGAHQPKDHATDAFEMLAALDSDVAECAFSCGVLDVLIELMQSGVGEQKVGAMSALAALIRHSTDSQRATIDADVPTRLLGLLRDGDKDERSAAHLVLAIVQGIPANAALILKPELVALEMATLCSRMCLRAVPIVLTVVVTIRGAAMKAVFIKGGVVPRLVTLLGTNLPDLRMMVAGALCNPVDADDAAKQAALSMPAPSHRS